MITPPPNRIRLATGVFKLVADAYEVSPLCIQAPGRTAIAAHVRQVSCYLLHHLGFVHQDIAQAIRRRDHGTSIHACKSVKNSRAVDPAFDSLMARLTDEAEQLLNPQE